MPAARSLSRAESRGQAQGDSGGRAAAATVAPAAHAPNGAATANGLRVSPAVRRLAREHAVDVATIHGTGSNGRVTAEDIIAAATMVRAQPQPPQPVILSGGSQSEPQSKDSHQPSGLIPLTPARRLIARRMVESKHNAPHAWTTVEVDVSELWAWRTAEKDAFERENGVKLTLLPFFMFAVTKALRAFPLMNASFHENGIEVHANISLG